MNVIAWQGATRLYLLFLFQQANEIYRKKLAKLAGISDSLESYVQLGSFNYSASAVGKNAENVLLLKNVPGIAEKYAAEWERLWDEGVDVKANY